MMEPARCREQLAHVIGEETEALEALITFLESEHEQLSSSDVTGLERAIREHQLGIARVIQADQARVALCRLLGHEAPDARAVESVLHWCDPDGTLAPAWGRCMEVAAKCRALNDRNGALVGARLRHVQARLATLVQNRGGNVSYGPRGGYAFASTGQVVKVDV